MDESVVLWAGKPLSREEEERTRRMVALLGRAGEREAAVDLARFLPGSGHAWTPDERARRPRGAVALDRLGSGEDRLTDAPGFTASASRRSGPGPGR
jgi:hypothetical protein